MITGIAFADSLNGSVRPYIVPSRLESLLTWLQRHRLKTASSPNASLKCGGSVRQAKVRRPPMDVRNHVGDNSDTQNLMSKNTDGGVLRKSADEAV